MLLKNLFYLLKTFLSLINHLYHHFQTNINIFLKQISIKILISLYKQQTFRPYIQLIIINLLSKLKPIPQEEVIGPLNQILFNIRIKLDQFKKILYIQTQKI